MLTDWLARNRPPTADAAALFAEPLVDLGTDDPRFAGILTPRSFHGASKVGVTAQFLENAEHYHARFFDTGYWNGLIGDALAAAGNPAPKRIIDIGSGSGNSVLPLADRFRDAQVIATDISPQLLAILRDIVRTRRDDAARFAFVCVDLTQANFQPGAAGLAVGAAILHHVLEPERVIASCHRALAPGGWAIFFEPFETGHTLLKAVYRSLWARASAEERATPGFRVVQRMLVDYAVRERPRSDPIYRQLDDKWSFTRTYFEKLRKAQGWDELITYALHVSPHMLRRQFEVQLRLAAGLEPGALPDWAWAAIDEADAGMSDDVRVEMAQEAAVLLRKR